MSAPAPATVRVPPLALALPAAPTAPMSALLHPAGSDWAAAPADVNATKTIRQREREMSAMGSSPNRGPSACRVNVGDRDTAGHRHDLHAVLVHLMAGH